MIKVFTVPLSEDLSEFADFLWQYEVPHRVIETENAQELWVSRTVSAEQIQHLYELWRQGESLDHIQLVRNRSSNPSSGFVSVAKRSWFSSALILLSVMVSFLVGFGDNFAMLRYFTIADIMISNDALYSSGIEGTVDRWELWRFLTPMLLHFSAPHLLFNLLWVWVVGTRIELIHGRLSLVLLVTFAAVVSNLSQYWETGPMFGGLSGVVFALLGYAWAWDKFGSDERIGLPPALMGLMLFWLALGYTGVLQSLGFGAIANTAHLMGLVSGIAVVPMRIFLLKQRS